MRNLFLQALLFYLSFYTTFILCRDTADDRLNKHGVPTSIRRAIQGMTSSGLKKDAIRKNLEGHFPSKRSQEINDIILLANVDGGYNQPREKDNKRETQRKIRDAQNKFDKWKSSR